MIKIKDFGATDNSVVLIMDRVDALLLKKAMELANTVSKEYFHDTIIQNIEKELNIINDGKKAIYNRLCEAVGKHSKDAEKYLREKAINLKSFQYDNNIDKCFKWNETPQGSDFWQNLNNLVGTIK